MREVEREKRKERKYRRDEERRDERHRHMTDDRQIFVGRVWCGKEGGRGRGKGLMMPRKR